MLNKIKIGYKDYVVESLTTSELAATGLYASLDRRTSKLKYDASLDAIEIADSILHEVLHGIYTQFGKKILKEDEEYYVGLFSAGLTGVFRDNPELLVLMQEAFNHQTEGFKEKNTPLRVEEKPDSWVESETESALTGDCRDIDR